MADVLELGEYAEPGRILGKDDCLHDFDHHGPAFAADPVGATRRARLVCPITYSPRHGGFWHVTGYDEAFAILQDDDTFASGDGVSIPPLKKKGPPIDVDPPLHKEYRTVLGVGTSRNRVAELADRVRGWAADAIDAVVARGAGDAVLDIASPVPAKAIMTMLGLPLDKWQLYADVWHRMMARPQDDDVYVGLQEVREQVFEVFGTKHGCPASDIMSSIWSSDLFDKVGCPISGQRELGGEISMTLLGAGVDTTTNMFAETIMWIARHPESRAELGDPDVMSRAVDEFFRYFSTAPALARTVTRDIVVFGHDFRSGDRVLVSFLGANHDPLIFDHPDELDIHRWPNRHMAFGVGRHRCLGSNLARMVFPILLTEFLTRIPEFTVDFDRCLPYADRAQVTGWSSVPISMSTPAYAG
jgi:cytochrome P450